MTPPFGINEQHEIRPYVRPNLGSPESPLEWSIALEAGHSLIVACNCNELLDCLSYCQRPLVFNWSTNPKALALRVTHSPLQLQSDGNEMHR